MPTFKDQLFKDVPPDRMPPKVTGGVRNQQYRNLAGIARQSYSLPPSAAALAPPSTATAADSSYSSSSGLGSSSVVHGSGAGDYGGKAMVVHGSSHSLHHLPARPQTAASGSHLSNSSATVRPSNLPSSTANFNNDRHPNFHRFRRPSSSFQRPALSLVPISTANGTPLKPNRHWTAGPGNSTTTPNPQSARLEPELPGRRSSLASAGVAAILQDQVQPDPCNIASVASSVAEKEEVEDWGAPPQARAAPSAIPSQHRGVLPSSPLSNTPSAWQIAHLGNTHAPGSGRNRQPAPSGVSRGGPSTPFSPSASQLESDYAPVTEVRQRAPWRTDLSSDPATPYQPSPLSTSDILHIGSSNTPADLSEKMASPRRLEDLLTDLREAIVTTRSGREREREGEKERTRERGRENSVERDRAYDRLDEARSSRAPERRARERSVEREKGIHRPSYRDNSRDRHRDRLETRKVERRERDSRDWEEREEARKMRVRKEEELDSLQSENAAYKRDIDKLTARMDRLLAERDDLRASDSSSELRTVRKENAKLEDSLRSAEAEVRELQREAANTSPSPRRHGPPDAGMTALLDEMDSLRPDKAGLVLKIRSLTQLVEHETKKRKDCETQAYSARTQQGQLAQERAKLALQVEDMAKELRMQVASRQTAEGKLRQLEATIGDLDMLKRELVLAKKLIDDLRQQLSIEQNRVGTANDRFNGLKKDFDEQQDKVRDLRRQFDGMAVEKKVLEEKVDKYRIKAKEYERSQGVARAAREANDKLTNRLRDMREQIVNVRSENVRLTRELEMQQQASARLDSRRFSNRGPQEGDHASTDEETPQPRTRMTAEERFQRYHEKGNLAPSRPRTAQPLGSQDDGFTRSGLPTLASGLDGSLLQPGNKRDSSPFDPTPINYSREGRPKSRLSTSSLGSQDGQRLPPHLMAGNVDWPAITPARPRSSASSAQPLIYDTDVNMSDSDSHPGAIAHPLAEQHTGVTDDSRVSRASSKGNTPPLILEGGDSVVPSPVKPAEASMGFETPAPSRLPDSEQDGGRTEGYSNQSSIGSTHCRAPEQSTEEDTPLSGGSTATLKLSSTSRRNEGVIGTVDDKTSPADSGLDDARSAGRGKTEGGDEHDGPTTNLEAKTSTSSLVSLPTTDFETNTQTTKIRRIKDMLYDPFANIGDDFGLGLPHVTLTSSSADKAVHLKKQDPVKPSAPLSQGRSASPPTPSSLLGQSQDFQTWTDTKSSKAERGGADELGFLDSHRRSA